MVKIAINGMGRIGRATLKIVLERPEFELAAINDLLPADNLAYLLRYDSVYGRYEKKVRTEGEDLFIDRQRIPVFHEKDPSRLPWQRLGIDAVFECTGVFRITTGIRRTKLGSEERK